MTFISLRAVYNFSGTGVLSIHMTVYADILFLVNFSLDYVSLYITGRLLSLKMSVIRLTAAGTLGGIFATLSLILDIDGILYISLTAAVTILMTLAAYKKTGAAKRAGAAATLFAVGSSLGGVMTAIYSLGRGYRDSLTSDTMIPTVLFIIITATSCAAVTLLGRISKRAAICKEAHVTITNGGASVRLKALPDSGNLLHEPISGRPVMIVRGEAVKCIFEPSLFEILVSRANEGALESLPREYIGKIRVIPVSGVTDDGVLLAYRPDTVTIEIRGGSKCRDCMIALSSANGKFGGCDAILPSEFI